jgi:Protein of unknown function (DUF1761)
MNFVNFEPRRHQDKKDFDKRDTETEQPTTRTTTMLVSGAFSFYFPTIGELLAVILSVVASTFLGMTWYSTLFGNAWMQLVCQYKGIQGKINGPGDFKKVTETLWPYPDHYCYLASMGCNIVKSWFLMHWLGHVLQVTNPLDAVAICGCWSTIHLVSLHQYFWQGKRMEHMAIDFAFEVTSLLLTGILVTQIPKLFA